MENGVEEWKKNLLSVRDEWKTSMKCSHSSAFKEYILLFCRHGNIFNLLNVWEDNFYTYIALSLHSLCFPFTSCILLLHLIECALFSTLLQWFVFHSFVSCQRKVFFFVQSWEDKIEIRLCVPCPSPPAKLFQAISNAKALVMQMEFFVDRF